MRQLMVAVLTLTLTASALADTGEELDGWRVATSRDEMSDMKYCHARSQLRSYGNSSSSTNGRTELTIGYSDPASNANGYMMIRFIEGVDQIVPFSDTIKVRFDGEPASTIPILISNDNLKGAFFLDKNIVQRARKATTVKVELDLLHNGRTVLTFSLHGSANAIDQAKAECSQGEHTDPGSAWRTDISHSEMDDSKTCSAATVLVLGGSVSNGRAVSLGVAYSSSPRDTPHLALVFMGDRPVSDAIRVRFDAEPAFTPLTVSNGANVIFADDSILERVRSTATMKVELNLLHQGRTTLTFPLRGSAQAMDSAKAECSRSE